MTDVMRVDAGWPLQPDLCHADLDLLTFIAERVDPGYAVRIFHMGPGLHHLVGFAIATTRVGHVLSLTNSREELDAWADRATIDPEVRRRYVCQFGDVQDVPAQLLPERLSIATLFHLGEGYDNPAADWEIVRSLTYHLRPGGHLLFYRGSSAWDRTGSIADRLVETSTKAAGMAAGMPYAPMVREADYRGLVVFHREDRR